MKLHTLKIGLVLMIGLLAFAGCEKGDTHHPDLIDGASMRIIADPTTQFIDAGDIAGSSIILHLYTVSDDIQKVELRLDYYSSSQDSTYDRVLLRTIMPSEFNDGVLNNLEFTTTEISQAVGIPVAEMGAGDRIDFLNFTFLEDGRIYPNNIQLNDSTSVSNVTPNVANSALTTNFTTKLIFFISCPFDADAAVGQYLITRDDFGTTLDITRPIEAVKVSPTQIEFINMFTHPEMYDVTVSVNLASGVATVARQPAWHCDNFGCGFGEGRVNGTGFFFSCTGFVTLDLQHTVDAGSFGTFKLELQKQ